MKDENEIKKWIIEALDLIPENVARIDLNVQLHGNVGNVKISFQSPVSAIVGKTKGREPLIVNTPTLLSRICQCDQAPCICSRL